MRVERKRLREEKRTRVDGMRTFFQNDFSFFTFQNVFLKVFHVKGKTIDRNTRREPVRKAPGA
jgi:hypothetical protein